MRESLGSMTIRAMCSELFSPMFVQCRPPSSERDTPSPYATDRWLSFSPVPTQTTEGFFGSIATHPVEKEASLSKTGTHVVPAFSVFHTPPEATAANHRRPSVKSTARSAIRPDAIAGPIGRSSKPIHVPEAYGPFSTGFSALGAGLISVFFSAANAGPTIAQASDMPAINV